MAQETNTSPPPPALPPPAAIAATDPAAAPVSAREAEAQRIVEKYLGWSVGAALIPLPGLDVAALMAVQIKLLYDLAKHYETKFTKNVAKSAISALLGGALSHGLGEGLNPVLKAVPGVGTALSALAQPAAATALTYAVGKVFIAHFESGGTLLTFNPTKTREYVQRQFSAVQQRLGLGKGKEQAVAPAEA